MIDRSLDERNWEKNIIFEASRLVLDSSENFNGSVVNFLRFQKLFRTSRKMSCNPFQQRWRKAIHEIESI